MQYDHCACVHHDKLSRHDYEDNALRYYTEINYIQDLKQYLMGKTIVFSFNMSY